MSAVHCEFLKNLRAEMGRASTRAERESLASRFDQLAQLCIRHKWQNDARAYLDAAAELRSTLDVGSFEA